MFQKFLYFHFRGEEFRKDFRDLSVVKAFFPSIQMVALTATAPLSLLRDLKNSLSLKINCKIVAVNPNRVNIYLDRKERLSNHHAYESYDEILMPIANDHSIQRENYPITIIYLKLKYCGYAYSLFQQVLKDKQYIGESNDPAARLFAQFHAPQTSRMKKDIISEIKKEDSRVRVILATSALGMGVDAPHVTHVIHITPPGNLESYLQEFGRAGRTGLSSKATLYFNKSDIASNKEHVDKVMKDYCKTEKTCLKKFILDYFGFSCVPQDNCCCICDIRNSRITVNDAPKAQNKVQNKVRMLCTEKEFLRELIKSAISDHQTQIASSMPFTSAIDMNVADKIVDGVEYIATESDLLESYGVWDETCSSRIFSIITTHAPLQCYRLT